VFSRRDVVVEVAPKLFGADPAEVDRVVRATLRSPEAIPLVATPTARERAYATATTVAVEAAVAEVVAMETRRTDAPAVDLDTTRRAMAEIDLNSDFGLNLDQRHAVLGLTTSGRGVELVVGMAGAGKTTAISAVRRAFEAQGYEVVGTSTWVVIPAGRTEMPPESEPGASAPANPEVGSSPGSAAAPKRGAWFSPMVVPAGAHNVAASLPAPRRRSHPARTRVLGRTFWDTRGLGD
jgi:hypothetical protein